VTGYTLGMAATARPWRARLQQEVRNHVSGVRLRLVMEERVALEEPIDVLLVDDDTSYLTPRLVRELQGKGTLLVGVFDPGEAGGFGQTHLRRLGIEITVPADVAPDVMLQLIDGLHPQRSLADEFDEVVAGLELHPTPTTTGTVIAVGGPPGAGATEVAVALAAGLARHGSVVLVDVDEVSPGVARRLGVALHPHLLTALDALHTDPDPRAIADCFTPRSGRLGFDVLAGIANRADWYLLRGGDVTALLDSLATLRRFVVVNLGPHLELLETGAGERHAASRAAAGAADRVVGVCEASPRGVLRFLDWLVELHDVRDDITVTPIVNRAPRSLFQRAELTAELVEHGGTLLAGPPLVVPQDRRVATAAWAGEIVATGPFTKALRPLVDQLAGPAKRSARWKVGVR
jgi:CO dehydrogenase nickel-insertion accessory protein CooC1